MFDPRTIANAILDAAWDRGFRPTNLDIQKIMYFLHGHSLREFRRPLINEEFEAWPYGPVSRTAYQAFKRHGDAAIDAQAVGFNPVLQTEFALPKLDDESALSLIDEYVGKYCSIPTFMLVQITHEAGTPWARTIEASKKQINIGMKIPDSLIVEVFEPPNFIVDDIESEASGL